MDYSLLSLGVLIKMFKLAILILGWY